MPTFGTSLHLQLLPYCLWQLSVFEVGPLLQSWLYGKAIEHFEPAALALSESHGYENSSSKHLMRLSVLASDIIGKCAFLQCAGRQQAPSVPLAPDVMCPCSAVSSAAGLQERILCKGAHGT